MDRKRLKKEKAWIIRDKYDGVITRKHLAIDLKRLKSGELSDYIIGWKPFLGCKIDLSLKPLIPRPETEFWTEKVILKIKKKKLKILDLFAGSGCVGVAVLKQCPNTHVDFAEINKKLTKQIKLSLKINKIRTKRCRVIKSDVFKNIKQKYDYILANPPYIPTGSKLLNKKVKKTEPKQALFAGKDGLYFIKKLLREAEGHLNKNGQIWIEFDSPQKKTLEKLIKQRGFASFAFFRDQYNKWRFVIISSEQ